MTQPTSKQTAGETEAKQAASQQDATNDEFAAGMVRTLEEINRDPLLHHRLSQRGF